MKSQPETHFNATELLNTVLKQLRPRPQVKISQFLDNYPDSPYVAQKITREGRYGGTLLPNELKPEFEIWLKSVGVRTNKLPLDTCQKEV